jgi:hypothetical protein
MWRRALEKAQRSICAEAERRISMTLEEKRIDRLYALLHQIEHKDPDMAAVLRWAIFELERIYSA